MKVEIFERATGKVLETKEVGNIRSFLTYWTLQCNSEDYGYRVVGEEKPAAKPVKGKRRGKT